MLIGFFFELIEGSYKDSAFLVFGPINNPLILYNTYRTIHRLYQYPLKFTFGLYTMMVLLTCAVVAAALCAWLCTPAMEVASADAEDMAAATGICSILEWNSPIWDDIIILWDH